jgi:hypothetical protein
MDKHAMPRDVPPRTFADGVGGGQGRTADEILDNVRVMGLGCLCVLAVLAAVAWVLA